MTISRPFRAATFLVLLSGVSLAAAQPAVETVAATMPALTPDPAR